jgi:hypothetical protein
MDPSSSHKCLEMSACCDAARSYVACRQAGWVATVWTWLQGEQLQPQRYAVSRALFYTHTQNLVARPRT